MQRPGAPIPRWLDEAIERVIDDAGSASGRMAQLVADSDPVGGGYPLIIKYTSTKYGGGYRAPGLSLRISETVGFTWGTGTYVTPLCFPASGAVFGRVGVVASFDPTGWRVFDAESQANQQLYLMWASYQPLYRQSTLTAQSAYYHQLLRNEFRRQFAIDCVLFPPDQKNTVYTAPADVWMNVTDWTATGDIATGWSARFKDPWFTVLVDEEFEDDLGGTVRRALLALTTTRLAPAATAKTIATAYGSRSGIVRIKA